MKKQRFGVSISVKVDLASALKLQKLKELMLSKISLSLCALRKHSSEVFSEISSYAEVDTKSCNSRKVAAHVFKIPEKY